MLEKYLDDIAAGVAAMTQESELTAQQIIGLNWPQNAGDAAELGRQISRAVKTGDLPRLAILRTNDRNHHVYQLRR